MVLWKILNSNYQEKEGGGGGIAGAVGVARAIKVAIAAAIHRSGGSSLRACL